MRLRVTPFQIKDAPSLREDEHLSPDVESRLRAHYGPEKPRVALVKRGTRFDHARGGR